MPDSIGSQLRELKDGAAVPAVLDALQVAVCVVDKDGKVLLWNDEAEEITGYLRQEVVGQPCGGEALTDCSQASCTFGSESHLLLEAMHEGKLKDARLFLRHKLGHRVLVRLRAVPIRDEIGHVIGAVQNFEELSLDRSDDYFAAYDCFDAVTGTPNEQFIRAQLQGNVVAFQQSRVPFSVLWAELPGLEEFEANRGREAREMILHVVAETLKRFLGARAILGRWKDTGFLIVAPPGQLCDVQAECSAIQSVAEKSEIHWWSDWLSLRVVVQGVSIQEGETTESLLDRLGCGEARPSSDSSTPSLGADDEVEKRENE